MKGLQMMMKSDRIRDRGKMVLVRNFLPHNRARNPVNHIRIRHFVKCQGIEVDGNKMESGATINCDQ